MRTPARPLLLPAALLALLVTGCGSAPVEPLQVPPAAAGPGAGVVVRVEEAEIVPYRGAWHQDPRLPPALEALGGALRETLPLVREEFEAPFREGRGPLILLDDAAPGPASTVTLRVVDGVRRPLIRVRTASLLTGAWSPVADGGPAVAHAALLAACGDRKPPSWVLLGAPHVLGGGFERLLARRVAGGDRFVLAEDAIFDDGPVGASLSAAVRVRALRRIARTSRPLGRYLDAALSGDDPLAAVGIHGPQFLDAAAGTERADVHAALLADPRSRALRRAREALLVGDVERADGALTGVVVPAQEDPRPWLGAELLVTRADVALGRREVLAAGTLLEQALTVPGHLARPGRARMRRVGTLQAVGRDGEALALALETVQAHPGPVTLLSAITVTGFATKGDGTLEAAAEVLARADAAGRAALAASLGEDGGFSAQGVLTLLTADPAPAVRTAALRGLALCRGRRSEQRLVAGTGDPDPGVRLAALGLLTGADRPAAVRRARDLRTDPDQRVRTAARALLGESVETPRPPVPPPPPERKRPDREDAPRPPEKPGKPLPLPPRRDPPERDR